MGKRKIKVWMMVTTDEYQFPIYLADSARELSKMCGVRSDVIELLATNTNLHKISKFVVVEIDDSDDL